nr:MAG TPA: hypothetical protein [Caudoviricetes sp.]DAG65289.1 MAG TPA: hypothetical protein [Caudoviricetes sp.]DAR01953.1 MAG TPA: hypothetical protein [Caudoviricetes sp.]DAR65762.1 MAG TPA: hypothetical protein [Caudoviricetes sp.]DAU49334.1 MAG TPA: hypothetical protein [Caudoviricetes sp.]
MLAHQDDFVKTLQLSVDATILFQTIRIIARTDTPA